MQIFLQIVIMVASIIVIIKGGDIFVDAASFIAEISGIPKLIVGATIVSVATTLPEMLVSCFAIIKGSEAAADMAIGNAVGSVTANIGLIMAISLICMPSIIKRKDYMLKSILMILASLVLFLFGIVSNSISVLSGILLFAIFAVATYDNINTAIKEMKMSKNSDNRPECTKKLVLINSVKFILGAAAIAIGADLLVDSATFLASAIGISERIISITILAIGTSLPELITTLTAISKKQMSLSVGNIIGANIIDLTLILPICAMINASPLPVTKNVAILDLPAALIVGCIATIPALITKKFHRWQGILILIMYLSYIAISCLI